MSTVALVTRASRGIGRSIAETLAAVGYAREGIAVNAVLPSVVETEMLDAVASDAAARAGDRPDPDRALRPARGSGSRGAVPGGGGARTSPASSSARAAGDGEEPGRARRLSRRARGV